MSKHLKVFYLTALWCLLIPLAQAQVLSGQASIDTITNRLTSQQLEVKINDAMVRSYITDMADNGSWANVTYVDSAMATWKPLAHLEHLKAMAIAFKNPVSSFFNNGSLKTKILSGLNYYLQRKPEARNWWYRDIGAPQVFMVTLLMLKGNIDREALLRYSAFLKDATGNPSHRGKNRSWVSEITIYKGCIEDDIEAVARGFTSIASTLAIDTAADGEGIKADLSFHQHHAQLYSGGYGLSLMSDYAEFISLARGTRFAALFTPEKRKLFENVLLGGQQRLSYRQRVDFGSVGRGISRQDNDVTVPAGLLHKMEMLDPPHQPDYRAWQDHLQGGPFPDAYRGNYHFWLSDIMTQHGADYYFSARIISNRTVGGESLNGENLKGYNLSLGATNIKVSGNEYHNIYPVWDWSRVPGTTAELNEQATHFDRYLTGNNMFGGGVSNGRSGIIAFKAGQLGINANKAYFFMNDMMVCLGAGIRAAKDHPVITSVNQCLSGGEVLTSAGKLTATGKLQQDLRWVYHDRVGYIFPANRKLTVQNVMQSGTWRSINLSGSADTVRKRVFSIWIDHGSHPVDADYQYIVVPDRSLVQFKQEFLKKQLFVVKNEPGLQAVRNGSGCYAIVFYKAGRVALGNGFSVDADDPVLLLINKAGNGYRIAAADPLYTQTGVHIRLSKATDQRLVRLKARDIYIVFPAGVNRGSTATVFCAQVP